MEEIMAIETDQFTRDNDYKQVLKDQTDQIARLYVDIFHLQSTIRHEETEKWRQRATNTEIIDNLKRHLNLAYLWHTETFEFYKSEDKKSFNIHRTSMKNRIQKAIDVLGTLKHQPFCMNFLKDQILLPEEVSDLDSYISMKKNTIEKED